ncbi:hypothetical protein ONZ51_g5001 [Trametes cubensis]|uniref:Uncharacterized protein n=1 Tax=Trametes cubensis TaxID=1111947 RepID=A0AAD7X9S8_9APHY|nr:hypothetical protein ONZ51_g5001 [Trametes cubensis]
MSWHNLAGEYGLPHRYASKKLEQHHVPTHCLPLSFHIELFKSSWRSADVYMDSIYQALGTTGFHVLRPMMLSLLALFHGRLIDNPVRRMAQETRNLVGEVTHEIFAMDDTIFIVLEVDMIAPQEQEHVARLFKLFISAAQDNHYSKSQVRIYGLLTDRVRFAFFSYDHSLRRFAFDEELLAGGPRGQYLTRLIPIANKIFNVLFSGYLALLQASAISKV